MSKLIEVWVTKTYKDMMDREFIFFMGLSVLSMEQALLEALGEAKYDTLEKEKGKWIAKNGSTTYLVEERTGQPPPPAHKRWSVYDGRFEMHLPNLKEIPDKLF